MIQTTERKVAIFVDDFSATGVVINAVGIARELQSRGASVEFVATQAAGTLLQRVPKGIPVTQLLPPGAEGLSRRDRSRGSLKAYRKFLKGFGSGVVFSAGNQGHLLTMLAAIGHRGLRIVIRVSNEVGPGDRRQPTSFLSSWLRLLKFKWLAARADHLVFVSRQLLQNWPGAGKGATAATVISNGVDVETVRERSQEPCPHPWFNDSSVPVVVGVGRLVEQKNFATLIRAVGIASRDRPLRLVLIGTGPQHETLLEQARAIGLSNAIDIIAPVANPMPFISRAAVVALPSWWEGASNVLLESLACETPVVASRSAGSALEVLDGGRFGVLVDPADAAAMAEAILTQTGPGSVRPRGRARDFSMASAMESYADLLLRAA